MIFGAAPVADAVGCILAHSTDVGGGRLKKGRLLNAEDVQALASAGHSEVIVARPDSADVLEDQAALRIAKALNADSHFCGLALAEPGTGRVNLHAVRAGLFDVQRDAVDRLNRIDPAITLATLPNDSVVEAGRMVATVKIIPFAVAEADVAAAEALARDSFMLAVHAPTAMRVFLVQTELPTVKTSVLDKTAQRLADRLALSGSKIAGEWRVPHSEADVIEAFTAIENVGDFSDERDMLVIFGASAITDRADVIPAALRAVGGTVSTVGMPVDPGNLLMTGRLGGRNVIGAPGCARSPAENGFDWVLQRIIHVGGCTDEWISGLGVGGLLMEIHDRPQPREG
ncbi:molybdopterin-binding protein [Ahrensia sp. R2A130]|uniref:molybdopterin-binding protein n=1 Tax=Ahrensia sp. R2A130 TaxID=744979 RepID=UPI0001E0BC46|nr:4-diphosphocytidyl-2C-methyl-D-erythritol synthase [Ahrensia sp. R2A130]